LTAAACVTDIFPTGPGADVAIGDAGTNTIATTLNMPRIYQIYRSFNSPPGSGYAPNASDFGFAFTSPFNLNPSPQRLTDAQGLSVIDELLTLEDVMRSNVLRDVIQLSSIKTNNGYCMQPMFRVIPGFVSKTHMLHGNDIIDSGEGDDLIIADDIRGFSAIDLTELAEIQTSRQILDDIVVNLSIRLSTLGYDTEYFLMYSSKFPSSDPSRAPTNPTAFPTNVPITEPTELSQSVSFNLTVGCDMISTSIGSNAFVVGDTLTLIGQTFVGASFQNPMMQIPQLFERMNDVQQVLVDLHYALYEIHLDLLNRSRQTLTKKYDQQPLHSLRLADDIFSSTGTDTVIGDSATLFFQIDRLSSGLTFNSMSVTMGKDLSAHLLGIFNQRQSTLLQHVQVDLNPSQGYTSLSSNNIPFADIPFYLSIGNDHFDLFNNSVLAVGDFATFGIVYSDKPAPIKLPSHWCPPNTPVLWHPDYSTGWNGGMCAGYADCTYPNFATQAECCNNAWTSDPRPCCSAGNQWYADYGTAWDEVSVAALRKYADSVNLLRKKPSPLSWEESYLPSIRSLDYSHGFLFPGDHFFYKRYDSSVSSKVKPRLLGDAFFGFSQSNVMFGGTLTTVGFAINGRSTFRDTNFNFYDDLSADHFDKNQVTVPSNSSGIPVWADQNTQDSFRGRVNSEETPACTMVNKKTQDFFDKHSIAMQVTSSLYVDQIQNLFQNDVGSLQNVCNKNERSYIPSHTLSIYISINEPTASPTAKPTATSVTTTKVRRLLFDNLCSLYVCISSCIPIYVSIIYSLLQQDQPQPDQLVDTLHQHSGMLTGL